MAATKSLNISAILFAPLLLCFSANAVADQYATSFNCTKASSQIEKTICRTKALADADIELGLIYKKLFSNLQASERKQLKEEQIEWLKTRNNSCLAPVDVTCMQALYSQRIEALKKWRPSTKA